MDSGDPKITLDSTVDQALNRLGIVIDVSTIKGLERVVTYIKENISIIAAMQDFNPWYLKALASLINTYNNIRPYEDQGRYHELWEELVAIATDISKNAHES